MSLFDSPLLNKYSEQLRTKSTEAADELQGWLSMKPTVDLSDPAVQAKVKEAMDAEAEAKLKEANATPEKKDSLGAEAEASLQEVQAEEEKEETPEEVLADLHKLVGMEEIKKQIDTLTNLIAIQKRREEAELPVVEVGKHLVLMGAPGTGKTTIARIIGRLYRALGVLSTGQLVEVDRGALVGGFVGQTAIKTGEALDKAKGGVLFVDEAYSLAPGEGGASGTDFGQEAIATILKRMEDDRLGFVVIVAGYPNEMKRFIDSNPGLESRFNQYVTFEDYTAEELLAILEVMLKSNSYKLPKAAKELALEHFTWFVDHKDENFSNGRLVRNYFESAVKTQANRLAKKTKVSKLQLQKFNEADLLAAFEFLKTQPL